MTRRRSILRAVPCLLIAAGLPLTSLAQPYPTRPINLVVPYAPGGVTDVVVRLVATELARELGQPVVVENVTGAGGNLGSLKAARAAPDGYTLLITQTSTVTNPLLDRTVRFHPVDSFTHIAFLGSQPLWLLTNPDRHHWKDVNELIREMKAAPGRLNYGSGGTGSASHLGMAYLLQLEGVQATHIPYRGMSGATTDLLSGSVDLALTPVAGSEAMVQSGKLKALAVTGKHRLKAFANVPTFAEAGHPGMDVVGWMGISGPRQLPTGVVNRLSNAVANALAAPALQAKLQDRNLIVSTRTPAQFTQFVADESARWGQLITNNDIKVQ